MTGEQAPDVIEALLLVLVKLAALLALAPAYANLPGQPFQAEATAAIGAGKALVPRFNGHLC